MTPSRNHDHSSVSRRTFTMGLATTATLGLGLPGTALGQENQDDAGAMICDVDMDQQFAAQMHLDSDPAGGGRTSAVHVSSLGNETTDYVCATQTLLDRGLTLGDVSSSGALTYDYYEGTASTNSVPDEVFLILQVPGEDGYYVAYLNRDDGQDAGSWRTRDVSSQLTASGWRAVQVPADQIDLENRMVATTNQVIIDTITTLRDSEPFADVLSRFGSDAELLAASIGTGWTTNATVLDVYFDNLVVAGQTYRVPAVINVNAALSSVGSQIDLGFQDGGEAGLSLADVDPDSIFASRYASIAPPVPGTQVERQAVQLAQGTDQGATITIPAGLLSEANTVLVYGSFAVDHPVSFLATIPVG